MDPAADGQPPLLTTSRLFVTPLTVSDADDMVVALSDPELYLFIGGAPPTLDALRDRYRRLVVGRSADGEQRWFNWVVRTRDGRGVGTVQATVVSDGRRAEIAWVTARSDWGMGYAREAVGSVLDWLRRVGVREVLAHVHPGNTASERVATNIGLTPTEVVEDGERLWTKAI